LQFAVIQTLCKQTLSNCYGAIEFIIIIIIIIMIIDTIKSKGHKGLEKALTYTLNNNTTTAKGK